MAIDLSALKTELLTDPSALGYQAQREAGNTNAYEIINAIVPADWSALTAAEKQRIELITGAGQVDVQNTNVRNQFIAAFGPGTSTRAALATLQNRTGSRAEQLFGSGVSVSSSEVAAALALP